MQLYFIVGAKNQISSQGVFELNSYLTRILKLFPWYHTFCSDQSFLLGFYKYDTTTKTIKVVSNNFGNYQLAQSDWQCDQFKFNLNTFIEMIILHKTK